MSGTDARRSFATRDVKRVIGLGLIAAVGCGVLGLLALFGLVTYRAGTGADPADAFHEIPQVPDAFVGLVTWLPDEPLDRAMEPTTRRSIESTWVRSWSRLDIARQTGVTDGLETWFQGALLDQVEHAVATRPASSLSQREHQLRVRFYSLDGSIVGLSAVSDLERTVGTGEPFRSIDTFDVVLLLSDGNWRLHSVVRAATAAPTLNEEAPEVLAAADAESSKVRWGVRR